MNSNSTEIIEEMWVKIKFKNRNSCFVAQKSSCRLMLICKTSFSEHINIFSNFKFVSENLISHLFPMVDRFLKKYSCLQGLNMDTEKNIFDRTRISRWLGQENEDNVARTRNSPSHIILIFFSTLFINTPRTPWKNLAFAIHLTL